MGVGFEGALRGRREPALHEGSYEQYDGQPEVDAEQDGDQDPGTVNALVVRDGSTERVPHSGSIALLAAAQLAWLGMLGLGLYWVGQNLF